MIEHHHDDPLSQTIKKHPIGYFCVMGLIGLAAGTIVFDLFEWIDPKIAPAMKSPRYLAAVIFAFGTHIGIAWRTKKTAKQR